LHAPSTAVSNAAPEKPDRLLIYVDQWEEL
jgi:hypothetical protein